MSDLSCCFRFVVVVVVLGNICGCKMGGNLVTAKSNLQTPGLVEL